MDEDLKPVMTRGEQVLYVAKMSLWMDALEMVHHQPGSPLRSLRAR